MLTLGVASRTTELSLEDYRTIGGCQHPSIRGCSSRVQGGMLLSEAVTAVLIGGAPRSGTTLLCDLLNEQPEVGLMSELFLGDFLDQLDPLFRFEDDHTNNTNTAHS